MTGADRSAFFELFSRVSRTFNRKPDAELCGDYFTALEAVPFDDVQAAADGLLKTSRYWPKPVDWLEAAQRARRGKSFSQFTAPVVVADGEDAIYHCHQCLDTGWRPGCGCELGRLDMSRRCPAHPFERHGTKYPEPLKACACRATNTRWQHGHPVMYVGAETHRGS